MGKRTQVLSGVGAACRFLKSAPIWVLQVVRRHILGSIVQSEGSYVDSLRRILQVTMFTEAGGRGRAPCPGWTGWKGQASLPLTGWEGGGNGGRRPSTRLHESFKSRQGLGSSSSLCPQLAAGRTAMQKMQKTKDGPCPCCLSSLYKETTDGGDMGAQGSNAHYWLAWWAVGLVQ